jgi:hypothetical protein
MGGNVTAINKKSGEEVRAEKIPIKEIGRSNFTKKFIKVFAEINKLYKKEYGELLWKNEKNIANGLQFNGSTSYIFNGDIPDEEIVKYKTHAGDLDIIVPEDTKEQVWELLDKLEGTEIIKGVEYIGSNKPTISSIGEQINTVFRVDFGKGKVVAAQVDFEFLPMEEDGATPTEWAKFSHSSSFEDAKAGVKAVHHKYLIQSLVGGASIRDDVVIVTPKATPENWEKKLKKFKPGDLPRFLKFSVSRGIRTAYEPLYDEDGNHIKTTDGKEVWREVPTASSEYTTIIKEIANLSFGKEVDASKFGSFVGVMSLMKEYLNKKQIKATLDRYEEKLFAPYAQVLERGEPEWDYQVKISGYKLFCKTFGIKENTKLIEKYYKNFPDSRNESFIKEAIRRVG